jgi:amidase
LERAEELDRYYNEHSRPIGPLHGLPVSFKDQFHVEGLETTMGYVGWIDTFEGEKGSGKERRFESQIVRDLRSLGAIPFAKVSTVNTIVARGDSN